MDIDKCIDLILDRGVIDEVLPNKEALKRKFKGKKFHIYIGIDATSPRLHLGHVQNLILLEDFRRLGAKVTVLFGNFTGQIGDPTGKSNSRDAITAKKTKENISGWKKQIAPILKIRGFGSANVVNNSRWYSNMNLKDFLSIGRHVTLQHLIERDMFEKRLKSGSPIFIHEFLYPILQGFDSVMLKVDAEMCGTDQKFNALVGRDLIKKISDKEKIIVINKLIEDEETGRIMSKTEGTGVFVDTSSNGHINMFGSIMSLSDGFIKPLMLGCTRLSKRQVDKNLEEIKKGVNPMNVKLDLAENIVGLFHGYHKANKARVFFTTQFQKREIPNDVPHISLLSDIKLINLLETAKLVKSRSYAKRKIKEGAVIIDGKKVLDPEYVVPKNIKYVKLGKNIVRIK